MYFQRKLFCVCVVCAHGVGARRAFCKAVERQGVFFGVCVHECVRQLCLEAVSLWISCCVCLCVEGRQSVFFFALRAWVKIMFSSVCVCVCVCVCGEVKRTWEEDALLHAYTLDLLHTACPQTVCVSVLENLWTNFFLCEQKQYIQCVCLCTYVQRIVCCNFTSC